MKTSAISTRNLILCALFSALIAIGAFIKIPIPMVPFTLQVLFTMLAGLLLGGKFGAISVIVYIALGLMGLPVFTEGGGIGYILKPTFGYIIGFAIGAYVTGKIAHKVPSPSYQRLLSACFAGLAIVYLLGMVWFYFIMNYYIGTPVTVWTVLVSCFLLVIPSDILFCFFSAFLAKRLIPILRKQ